MTKAETKTFLEILAEVPEHRKGNVIKYSLRDVLFLATFAILCGAETYTGMQTFSELHEEALRKYLELPHGIPSHDAFGDILSRVDIKAVNECFRVFKECLGGEGMKDTAVALDGKTIRRSQDKKYRAFHIETAYLSDMEIVLGQTAVDEKTNEITAIPELLKSNVTFAAWAAIAHHPAIQNFLYRTMPLCYTNSVYLSVFSASRNGRCVL